MDITDQSPQRLLDQPPPARLGTFVEIAMWQAQRIGDRTAFTFLDPGQQRVEAIDYATLDRRIRAVAAALAANGQRGQRVLIVQQPGIEYITSLFACLYAGMVAVPVYPLDVFRLRHTLPRLQAITRDADAPIMLTSTESIGGRASQSGGAATAGPLWDLCRQAVILTDEVDSGMADVFRPPVIAGDDLAILQYTSGTTAAPRGVALCHRHLLANAQQIYCEYHVPDAVCVFWLPPYHDMGLVGGLLLPMFAGRQSVLMSPTSFVQQPIAWLRAISDYRGTTTASPNFGYELCLRKIGDDALQSLDLSSLRVAISGAEPIRANTMRRFAQRFTACGFRSSAFTPAYGMAEATLAITGKPREEQPIAVKFSASALHGSDHVAIPLAADLTQPGEDTESAAESFVEVVSCGVPLDRTEVRIVDPETLQAVSDQRVGEIWVRGPSVADHYWDKPELSQATFAARLAHPVASPTDSDSGDQPTYLRTGDLGFFYQGELFVSGRLKDLIIIAGRNFFAHEIEAAIQSAHEAFKVDGGVACSVDVGVVGDEQLVVIQELLRPKKFDHAELIEVIRTTLLQQFNLLPHAIVLVAAGSLGKTSSGKLQRSYCRSQFLQNELQVLTQWTAAVTGDSVAANVGVAPSDGDLSPTAPGDRQPEVPPSGIATRVAEIWCDVLEIDRAESSQHFLDLGGHSLAATALLARIRESLGVTIDFDVLLRAPRLGQLTAEVERLSLASGSSAADLKASGMRPAGLETRSLAPDQRLPLTASQRRFWLLDQLDYRQAFLYVEASFCIDGWIETQRLASIIAELPTHHDSLRLRFDLDQQGQPYQTLASQAVVEVRVHDLRTPAKTNPSLIRSRVESIRSALTDGRFDLTHGPLLKAALIRLTDTKTVVAFAGHHIVCDGSSLQILVRQIADRYNQVSTDDQHEPASFVQYLLGEADLGETGLDASSGSTDSVQLPAAEASAYWSNRLCGVNEDFRLSLPPVTPNHPNEPFASQSSRTCAAKLPPEIVTRLRERCSQWGVTPFEIILAAWHSTLSHYSDSREMVLGVPVAGRDRSYLEPIVGCFINTLPVRLEKAPGESFVSLVNKVSNTWRSDRAHADAPLDEIIQALGIRRTTDRLPLVQHLVLHQPPLADHLLLGEARCGEFSSAYSTLGAYDTALVCQWRRVRESSGESQHLMEACDLTLAYSPNALDDRLAEFLLEGFVERLSQGLSHPDSQAATLSLRGANQAAMWKQVGQPTRFHSTEPTVLDLFARQVHQVADQAAIVDADGVMTFRQLDEVSSRVAIGLRRRGVTPHSIVALRLTRSRQIVVAALAVWKSGAAYLPLDPAYPEQRLAEIVEDAQPHLILLDADLDSLLSSGDDTSTNAPLPSVDQCHLAYLIYTSGSTGKPKGVMIGHDNLSNLLQAFADGFGLAAGNRILASTTMSFDISILELFLPLVVGATTVIAKHSLSEDPDAVVALLAEHAIDVVQATPSSLRMMFSAGWKPHSGQTVWCGGEPLQIDLASRLTEAGVSLWNVYGPTETTVWSLAGKVSSPVTQPISIGRPIDSTTIRIVDSNGFDCPVGVCGELLIGGSGVGRGYWNRQSLTDERFLDVPSHGRMYRTGDMVRLLPDGTLEFLGRADRQVKIRGHRVELGEIESVLNRCDEVVESAVTLVPLGEGDLRLIAFFQPRQSSSLDPADAAQRQTGMTDRIKQRLAVELPPHMIPAVMIPLSEIPHTPAGKIDYNHLPIESCVTTLMLQSEPVPATGDVVPPRSQTEATVASIWSEVLRLPVISVHDHFFQLGGHSLMAAQVFARFRSKFGVQLPLREIYSHPTVAGLAQLIDAARAQVPAPANLPHAPSIALADPSSLAAFCARQRVQPQSDEATDVPCRSSVLSAAEQRLWFVDQLEPNHPFYNLPLAAVVEGPLDTESFWRSVQDCVNRHETLRSTYHVVDGTPTCQVHPSMTVVPQSIDLRPLDNPSELLRQQMTAHSRRPFDLEQGPLIRVIHWRLSEQKHAILIVMHHIISDGWSMSVMMRELAEFYRGYAESTKPDLRPLAVTYRQYAAWQQQSLTAERMEPALRYWQEQLAGSVETLDLPTDYPRPAEQDFNGATRPIHLSGDLSARLGHLAEQWNVTPFSILLATYGLLLSRFSGQRDLTIGTAVANRADAMVEELIGFFVNTVVIRQQPQGTETFRQWVEKVHQTASDAIEHQEVAFEQVVASLATQRDRSHSPLFQAAFVLQNTPDALVAAEGLNILPIHVDSGTAKYDLTLLLSEAGGMFVGHIEYRRSLFHADTIDTLIQSFLSLLQAGIESAESELHLSEIRQSAANAATAHERPLTTIDDLPLLSPQAEAAQRRRNHHPSAPHPWLNATADELFAQSTARSPAAPAIRHAGRELSYQELDARVQQIARGLQVSGVGYGDRVLVYSARSIDQVACLFAVLRCGAAFVPIDTQVPVHRVARIACDLQPKLIVTGEGLSAADQQVLSDAAVSLTIDHVAGSDDGQWESVAVQPSDLAYLIFTSGSTGTPKGVAVEHRSLCNFVHGYIEALDVQDGMRCAYLFSPSFDGALGDIFPALAAGAALEIIDHDLVLDPPRLAHHLTQQNVAMVSLTPATLELLAPESLPSVQRLLSAGAALPGEIAAKWLPSHALFNGYGPTECTIGSSIHRVTPEDLPVPSAGKPLPHVELYVLDSQLRLVPEGVIGEIYIGGVGVARGYWKRDDLTANAFVPNPFATTSAECSPRLYRSGDLGRWNRFGNLEIVGRSDEQIKLRGFRIEPGEITAVLNSLPGVHQSAVIAWGGDDTNTGSNAPAHTIDRASKRLVAYIVPREPQACDCMEVASAVSASGMLESPTDDAAAEREHIENWRHLFDQSQRNATVVFDPENDFSLWTSVITGRAIPTEEMRSWADETACRIKRLAPQDVLEIGCGTGLVLLRIGDPIASYHGIDVLQSAIDELNGTLASRPELGSKVTLDCRTADQLDDLQSATFDTIILNSVVQYFPSEDYLVRVLQAAQRLLKPGGRIFLGDLRNLRLHRSFAIAAELYKTDPTAISVGQFRARVRSRIDHDEELLVDPDLMSRLASRLERLRAVTTEVKTFEGDNELNRFRYDAVLWFDRAPEDLPTGAPAVVCNANVHREAVLDRWLDSADASQPLSTGLAQAEAAADDAYRPAAIHSAARELGWDVHVDWHPTWEDAMQVNLVSRDGADVPSTWAQSLGLSEYAGDRVDHPSGQRPFTNRPLARRQSHQLIQSLKASLQERLPAYMVPTAFVIVDRLPLTIQGKLDRNALPPPPTTRQSTGASHREPVTPTQQLMVQVWEELLEISPIGIDEDFFELGGHSMLAVRMVAQVQQRVGKSLPLSALFRKPTIEQLSDLLDQAQVADQSLVVPLAIGGNADPIFCIHPAGGTVFCYRELSQHLSGTRSVFGVQARGLDGLQPPHTTLREMASDYADAILATAPHGTIHLVGWSMGGNVAYEVARQLRAMGRRVGMLALLDAGMLAAADEISEDDFLPLIAALFPGEQHDSLEALRSKTPGEQLAYFINQAAKAGIIPEDDSLVGPHVFDVFQANIKAVHDAQPGEYAGRLLLIRPNQQVRTSALFDDQSLGWATMVGSIELATVSGDHAHMLQQPAVAEVAGHLNRFLNSLESDSPTVNLFPDVVTTGLEPDVSCMVDTGHQEIASNGKM